MVVHSIAHSTALCTGKRYFPVIISHFSVPGLEESFVHFCMNVTRVSVTVWQPRFEVYSGYLPAFSFVSDIG